MNPAANAPQNNPLAQLRDIHLPETIGWWPPAYGWWVSAILLSVLVFSLCLYSYRRWVKNAYKRQALKQLKKIQDQHLEKSKNIKLLAELLRQTAIAAQLPQAQEQHGDAWKTCLQKTMPENIAQLFAIGRYQKTQTNTIDEAELFSAVNTWIKYSHKLAQVKT